MVGQIAKLEGCRVIDTVGTSEKCRILVDELGFDAAINYREAADLETAIAEHAPAGVDVFFDNVGGPLLAAALASLRMHGRAVICGRISQTAATELYGVQNLVPLIASAPASKALSSPTSPTSSPRPAPPSLATSARTPTSSKASTKRRRRSPCSSRVATPERSSSASVRSHCWQPTLTRTISYYVFAVPALHPLSSRHEAVTRRDDSNSNRTNHPNS